MTFKSSVCFAMVVVTLFTADLTFGQRGHFRLKQDFRYLGGGQCHGYQWRTPGPCVGYYNPYSRHNTESKTGMVPQGARSYMAKFGINHSYNQMPMSFDQAGSLSGYEGQMYHQQEQMHPLPINYNAPPEVPSNIVDSEVESDEEDVSYEPRSNGSNGRDSILDNPEESQSSPSDLDEPSSLDESSFWRGFELDRSGQRIINEHR